MVRVSAVAVVVRLTLALSVRFFVLGKSCSSHYAACTSNATRGFVVLIGFLKTFLLMSPQSVLASLSLSTRWLLSSPAAATDLVQVHASHRALQGALVDASLNF